MKATIAYIVFSPDDGGYYARIYDDDSKEITTLPKDGTYSSETGCRRAVAHHYPDAALVRQFYPPP